MIRDRVPEEAACKSVVWRKSWGVLDEGNGVQGDSVCKAAGGWEKVGTSLVGEATGGRTGRMSQGHQARVSRAPAVTFSIAELTPSEHRLAGRRQVCVLKRSLMHLHCEWAAGVVVAVRRPLDDHCQVQMVGRGGSAGGGVGRAEG